MSLEIFDTGQTKIIGILAKEGKEKFFIKYPGILIPLQKDGKVSVSIQPLVVPFVENHNDLVKQFLLSKNLVLYHGRATRQFDQAYENYKNDLIKSTSGIHLAKPGDMKRIAGGMGVAR